MQIQNLFLTAQSMQIKSVISVPIKDFIHNNPRAPGQLWIKGGADWAKARAPSFRGPNPKICGLMSHMGMKRIRQ